MFRSESGQVWGFGSNAYGQLGLGKNPKRHKTPRKLTEFEGGRRDLSHFLKTEYLKESISVAMLHILCDTHDQEKSIRRDPIIMTTGLCQK